ncbi:choline/Carnitine o-acyltransferase domain-containing protein [Hirsutella rhossiliensis]|uniref:Carnitine O-acetyltransferase, mitochondrial n=1 Tax=Hirsutella rhossiliensis TaxID=111463 RepID=A0A9P8N041_9HYPO|nr:choline/Carnitine o-acyltransferase domain-containing protein [Hirsutella rhossiliensis]KAH0964450.1 choline/Carnitine o-acyltransferase domain-containing protein [Hirsutella rhossiliensis]
MAPVKRNNSSLPPGYVEDKSRGPTLRFQDSLPRLPVPTLEETAKRYLKSLHPLLSTIEFEASSKAVAEFVKPGGAGTKLQERLVARREDPATKNWIYDWWNEAAYLAYRDPVVPYVSYFYSHRDDRKRRQPAKRAAAITSAVLDFKKLVDGGTLEPEYMKKLPICMDSYKWMFNASRVAARPADYPVKFSPNHHKHFIVIRKNQFFRVPHEVGGTQLNPSELEMQFNRILEVAQRVPAVGILTSENRDVWADARQLLLQAGPRNKAALEAIESASFIVCLDNAAPVTLEERAHQYWHGDGANRWFDKPLQFIVNDNGTSGFMGEHSMMDGTPTHRLNDYVNNLIFGNKIDLSDRALRSDLPEPELVQFDVSPQVQAEIDRATKDFHHVINQHELAVQAYQGYGKGLIKQFRCSPDAYVQMIIQLAYFKMYGKNRPTYESAATRRFQLGRTETCRSVSDESVAWCAAMADPSLDEKTKVALFRKAIDAHIEYITAASDGKGVDRHLFGLKKLLKPGEELPAIYMDRAYGYSSSWYLSTSQLSSEYFNGYGWSQVIDSGFGIAYMINESSINFNIVSKCLGSQRMSYFLAEAASEMRDLLTPTLAPLKAKL